MLKTSEFLLILSDAKFMVDHYSEYRFSKTLLFLKIYCILAHLLVLLIPKKQSYKSKKL